MKMSKLRNKLADMFKAKPLCSKATHWAYTEQFVNEDNTYTGRVYSYDTHQLLEEFEGNGDRVSAKIHAAQLLKNYKRKD